MNYTIELDIGLPDRMPGGTIYCPPPAGDGQGDTGQTAPQLASIEVSPSSVDMQVGEHQVFTATGKDQNGTSYPLSNPTWNTSGSGTLSNCSGATCTYTATQAGDHTLTVEQDGVRGTASIHTWTPTQLMSIDLTPSTVDVGEGEHEPFTATGKDQNGDPYPLTNPVWNASGGTLGDDCQGSTTCTYTATMAGDFTITATQGGTGIQGTAKIQVKPTQTSALPWVVGGVVGLGAAGLGIWYFLKRRK